MSPLVLCQLEFCTLYFSCRYKKAGAFLSDLLISSVTPRSCSLHLCLKGNMEAYWIKRCHILIDLLTNSKFTAVLSHRKLHLLLKDRYIVSTGLRGCFLMDCSCWEPQRFQHFNCWSRSIGNRAAPNKSSTSFSLCFKGSLQILFKSVLIQYHIPCWCHCRLIAA